MNLTTNWGRMAEFTKQQILDLIKRDIVTRKIQLPVLDYAFDGGNYLGCPGKEIYHFLISARNDDIREITQAVSLKFPSLPPSRAVHLSSFLRYVYGCFEKQGALKHKEQFVDNIPNWNKVEIFMDDLLDFFSKQRNQYGAMICYEMMAHRAGDLAVLNSDSTSLKKMLDLYNKSANLAVVVGARKNAYSTYYWALRYLLAANATHDDIVKYALLFFDRVNQYCNTITAKGKIVTSLNRIYEVFTRKEWRVFRRRYKKYTNPYMKVYRFVKLNQKIKDCLS